MVAVLALQDGALPHVEADGAFEGGDVGGVAFGVFVVRHNFPRSSIAGAASLTDKELKYIGRLGNKLKYVISGLVVDTIFSLVQWYSNARFSLFCKGQAIRDNK